MLDRLGENIVVTGHYGSGKTNFSLNLAVALAERKGGARLADLDVVNPFFRSAEHRDWLRERGIEVAASPFAAGNLDAPALSPEIGGAILRRDVPLVLDVGGDDAGATVLGRYAGDLAIQGYDMLFVVNFFRPLTRTPDEALRHLRSIELASRLKAGHLVNCSNLASETTAEDIAATFSRAEELSALSGIPLLCTAVRRDIVGRLPSRAKCFPVDILVKPLW